MTWSVGRATWVGELDDHSIEEQVGSRTFERGRAYAADGKVRSLASRPEGQMILGTVTGSRSETYQVIVETSQRVPTAAAGRARGTDWWARCSCPVATDCKHAVALLLTARDVARGGPGSEGGPDSAGSGSADAPSHLHWASILGHAKPRPPRSELESRRPEPRGDLMPAGLFVDTIYRSDVLGRGGRAGLPELGYGLRPTRVTRTGTWHKTLSWHEALPQWRGGLRYLPEHERIMTRLRDEARHASGSTTYFTTSPPLSLDASEGMWPLLSEARDAGIEIMAGEGVIGPVAVLDEAATLELAVTRSDDSGDLLLTVVTHGMPDVVGEVLHLGDPVHGLAIEGDDGSLTLAPLDNDLGLDRAGLLSALDGLRVPANERATFLRTAMPGLRQRVRVRSEVPLPVADAGSAPEPARSPEVTVHVKVVGEVMGEIRLELGYAYDGRVPTFSTARFGGAARDRGAEFAALEAAESVHDIVGATRRDHDGHPYLVAWILLRGADAARFVTDLLPRLEADDRVTVEIDGHLPAYEEVTTPPVIRIGIQDFTPDEIRSAEPGDWFDLQVSVEVDGEEVPFTPLFQALAAGEEIMLLDSGSWFRLDRPELERLRVLIEEAREIADPQSGGYRLSAHHADLWQELVALGVVDRQSARWATNVQALAAVDSGPPAQVPEALKATLRPYQVDGFRWLSRLWDARIGGILADDMGLGKTLQTIATLVRAHERGELGGNAGPVLVVAPTSVVGTWLGEFETFAPHLAVAAVGDTERKRGRPLADVVAGVEVVVTSYAVLRLDAEAFQRLTWAGVVLDEAQFVKNRQAKTHVSVRKLGAPFTIAVTGTPLENSLMDLWSLLSLTAPGLYPRPDVFTKNYRRPIESGSRPELLDHLRKRIRPLMLRRTKEQVAVDLPPKQIQVVPVPPHPVHAHIYDQHLQRERQRVLGLLGDPDANRVAILAALTRLRQLALDPALVDEAYAGRAVAAKVEFLVEQLSELAAEGHRALVFSQFTGFLKVVEAACDAAGLRTCYLDGSTTDRQSVIRRFRDGESAAFLISLKAGGFGLTLTEADYVFVLDPWWNPAAEAQAIDRAHRIGQDKPVTVYRLVSAGTIEEKVVALQERKRDLFQRVVDEGGALSGAITSDDVKDLLGLA